MDPIPPSVAILDRAVDVPQTDAAGRYVAALMRNGVAAYVDAADVTVNALGVNGAVLPIVINDGRSRASDVWSPSAHYCLYAAEEWGKRHPRVPRLLWRSGIAPVRLALEAASLDRVVFVNNWLLTTNPSPSLSASEIRAVTGRLRQEYPDSAIALRSVNLVTGGGLGEALTESGYRLIRSRCVFMLDAGEKPLRRSRNARHDAALLDRTAYELVHDPRTLAPHAARFADLYRGVYLVKHSRLNPRFTARFFELTLSERIFDYVALVKDGSLDGFVAFGVERGLMIAAMLGYDRSLPRSLGLYRLLVAALMREAAVRNVPLNMSAGAGGFKMLRGARPVEEFDAVYDRHLPAPRRLAWRMLKAAGAVSRRWRGPA